MQGAFFTFEGIDHCGKDTQLALLEEWLKDRGFSFSRGNEPNEQSLIVQHIRTILTHQKPAPTPFEMQRLFVIDRAEDIIALVRPALKETDVVLRSRFALSTIAYGMLESDDPEQYLKLHHDVIGPNMIWPDITFLIDISAQEAMRRIEKNQAKPELFEQREKLEKIRKNYLALAKRTDVGRVIVINGERTPPEVFKSIVQVVQNELKP